jgi:RimJ/RimL family protein N-acetyltransferase
VSVHALALPIHTSRLILRDFQPDDLDRVHAYASDPDVTRFMFFDPRTLEETHRYLDRMLASQREVPRMTWELAIVQRADRRLVGACDLTLEEPTLGDLGFILSKEVWRLGYATEATSALVQAGFEQLQLQQIFATCDVANRRSARVLEKAGLGRRATLYRHKFARNRWWTSFRYEITRDEWFARGREK